MLDEPFSGLDALVRDEFIRGILELSDQSDWTIFISSHDIDEVERLADHVGIIKEGKLDISESVPSLLARFREIEIVVPGGAQLPKKYSPYWINLEVSALTLRFVETWFRPSETEKAVRQMYPTLTQFSARPLSLREIFLSLARHYRGKEQITLS